MIRISLDRKHCVNCGNCFSFLGKKFYIEGKVEISDHEWNGKTKELVQELEDKCPLELIKVEPRR